MLPYKPHPLIDRKLQSSEFPHRIHVSKYSSKGSSSHIHLKKWLFTQTHEVLANRNATVLDFFYHQVSHALATPPCQWYCCVNRQWKTSRRVVSKSGTRWALLMHSPAVRRKNKWVLRLTTRLCTACCQLSVGVYFSLHACEQDLISSSCELCIKICEQQFGN